MAEGYEAASSRITRNGLNTLELITTTKYDDEDSRTVNAMTVTERQVYDSLCEDPNDEVNAKMFITVVRDIQLDRIKLDHGFKLLSLSFLLNLLLIVTASVLALR